MNRDEHHSRLSRPIDAFLLLLLIALFSASPVPDVNEAHYLTKARQFWHPDWLPLDFFLTSGFSHWLFYVVWGWPAAVFELETAAWIGRLAGWLLLAAGWESLATAVGLGRGAKLISVFGLLGLIQVGNLSGEWLAGGIEAKVPAYGLVFFALGQAALGRWIWAWPLVGLAAGFHVLVGGWSFLALGIARALARRDQPIHRREWSGLVTGVILLMGFGVAPAVVADLYGSSSQRLEAATIYVRQRLSHHLYFWEFSRTSILLFASMAVVWRELQRKSGEGPMQVVHRFAGAALALVVVGIGLSAWSGSDWHADRANGLLRFYWFRLADVAIPAAIALGAAKLLIGRKAASAGAFHTVGRALALRGFVIVSLIGWLSAGFGHWSDARPGADRQSLPTYPDNPVRTRDTYFNWERVCRWIDNRTPADALFLTPRHQQTFHWYARRAEFVNWKNIPQNADAISAWAGRMDFAYGVSWDWPQLALVPREQWAQWLDQTGVDYVVLEQSIWSALAESGPIQPLRQIYPEFWEQRTTYVVLKVDRQPALETTDSDSSE